MKIILTCLVVGIVTNVLADHHHHRRHRLEKEEKATKEIQSYAEKVRTEIEALVGGSKFELFKVIIFRKMIYLYSQSETHYFMKIQIKTTSYIHVRISRHKNGKIKLHGAKKGFTLKDPIEYFE